MILFIILALLILGVMIIYIFFRLKNFLNFCRIKNKAITWVILVLDLIILISFLYIDQVNTIVILLNFVVFLMIFDLILWIAKKVSKNNFNYGVSFICAILVTSIYLGLGVYNAYHICETRYEVETTKDIGVDNFRIVQLTDSHLGTTLDGDELNVYVNIINEKKPDIVVITGDFVDDDTSFEDMIKGTSALGKLKTNNGVYFSYGNHDKGYFNYRNFDDIRFREELEKNNVVILEDESLDISDKIILLGRQDTQVRGRKSAQEMTKGLNKNKYIVALDHEPNDYENEKEAQIDLVLSGHSHGGQMIPIGQLSVILGINDSYYGLERRDNTTFIVSSGISDWAFKFKTGTKSEYTVIDLKNNKK